MFDARPLGMVSYAGTRLLVSVSRILRRWRGCGGRLMCREKFKGGVGRFLRTRQIVGAVNIAAPHYVTTG
jgi:hypothetical protein